MTEQINIMAELWWGWMWPMFWQVGVLIALVWVVDVVIRGRLWPQVRHALWLLVLLKLVLPPGLALPTSVTSQLQPLARDSIKAQIFADPISPGAFTGEDVSAFTLVSDTGAQQEGISSGEAVAVRQAVIAEEIEKGGVTVVLRWQAYVMLAWLLGVLVLTGWLLMRFRQLRRVHRAKAHLAEMPESFERMIRDAAKKLKLRRVPEVVLSRGVVSPAVFGAFRPVLLMPARNIRELSRKENEHILLHEVAHIRRGDLKVHAFYMVLQIIYWFNPLLWLVRHQLQHLRELCCDATVARILRDNTRDYRETIVETVRRLLAEPAKVGVGLLGLFEDSSRLSARLNWLEKKTWKRRGLRIVVTCVIVAVMCLCVLPMARGRGRGRKDSALVTDADSREGRSEFGSDDVAESRAWYIMRQWNGGPLLLGLTQQLGKVIVPSRRDDQIWKGVEKGGNLKLNIAVEGDVSGEIFVGFFSDAKWSAEPVQVRNFPGPGEYVVEKLPAGKFQVGAMVGTPPVADALGVHRTWPELVEIKRGATTSTEVLVSEGFQQHASGWYNHEVSRGFMGDWEKVDPANLLQGRVSGPDGAAIAHAQIMIREYKADPKRGIAAPETGADEQGRYYFDGIEWPYQVGARWREMLPEVFGHRSQTILRNRVLEGAQTVNFRFDAFATGKAGIKGRVVDQNGNAVPEFHLWLVGPVGWEKKPWDGKSKEDIKYTHYSVPFISDDGSFELSGLPAGVFEARAIPFNVQAYETRRATEVNLEEGKTTEAEVTVTAKNVLYGRILYEDGNVPRADEIRIVMAMGGAGRGRGVGGVDSDGYFGIQVSDSELEAVKAGTCTISVMGKDIRRHLVSDGDVEAIIVGKSTLRIIGKRDWHQLGTFPTGLLSAERSKAGVLKVPRVPPKDKEPTVSQPSAFVPSGKRVAPFELLGADGKTYRLENYKGKVVLLNIFATWCAPCVAELPHLLDLKNQFEDKGLVILAISHKETPLVVESYARRHDLPYPVLVDETGKASGQFAYKPGQIAFPTNVLLNREHRVVLKTAGFSKENFAELQAAVSSLVVQK